MDKVAVDRFRRYGNSKTDLYLISHHPHGQPMYVVKLGPLTDIDDEFSRTETSGTWINQSLNIRKVSTEEQGRAALSIDLLAANDGDSVVELDDVYQAVVRGERYEIDDLVGLLDSSFAVLAERAHVPSERAPQSSLGDHFKRYRRDSWPDRCGRLFSVSEDVPPVRVQDQVVEKNPLDHLEPLSERLPRPMLAKWVHGDLHPSNVVFTDGNPSLIDFAWREQDDVVCKDFVMMESAFRFMRFPRYIHPHILESVDTALNTTFDTGPAQKIVTALPEGSIRTAMSAMVAGVDCVRRNAREIFARFDGVPTEEAENEYFTCLYLVLAGQQRFDTFPLIRVVGNLHQLVSLHLAPTI
jgi:hypothetical protein